MHFSKRNGNWSWADDWLRCIKPHLISSRWDEWLKQLFSLSFFSEHSIFYNPLQQMKGIQYQPNLSPCGLINIAAKFVCPLSFSETQRSSCKQNLQKYGWKACKVLAGRLLTFFFLLLGPSCVTWPSAAHRRLLRIGKRSV